MLDAILSIYIQEQFSNIKVCFLPANTTSKLQPLDLAKFHKVHYRMFMQRLKSTCASEVCIISINVLVAIRWVAMAWSLVQEETVQKFTQGWCS